ncbi:LapA family protein [Crocinitomix catalasitica]|uniref:hypothetical protein n=1 Tax=Crocinitomix catalasitica TaxID=184607 RepID=UPI00048334F3|nr:hypothetical protein [Crocinitomix catalasitica]
MSESTENKEQVIKEVQPEVVKVPFLQKVRLVMMTLLSIVLITFIVQNSNKVELEFFNMTFRVRIIFIILFSAIIGGLINFLLMKHRAAKKRKK